MLQVTQSIVSESPDQSRPASNESQLLEPERLQQLMCRIVNRRDKHALSEIFELLSGRILHFAQRQTGDIEAAREILQDAMMAVWQKGHTYNSDKAKVTTWLFTIVRNLCYDLGRRKMSRPQLVSGESLYADLAPEENGFIENDCHDIEALDNPKIEAALDQLPQPQRQAVALVFLKECSHQEAAEILGIPVGTLKSRVRLGLARLSQTLTKRSLGYE
ncbi:MAG: sigma-70 family RNA polymerase sigma factor [Candidatus Pelagadaptatus aseana]|uniref:sigma-70 family RNA polymerase sigma factor n=1 Tax=Candidatus Pelagadaptatus aseana TaxID=3120508 RepID=UPI0039B16700